MQQHLVYFFRFHTFVLCFLPFLLSLLLSPPLSSSPLPFPAPSFPAYHLYSTAQTPKTQIRETEFYF